MQSDYKKYLAEGQNAAARYSLSLPRNIQQGLVGDNMGNRTGTSLEFMDHREYMPGDDLRHVNWNAYARSDKLSIKLYRNEVTPHIDILIDCSGSMALEDSEKAHSALGLAALFAQAAANASYTFTAWQIGDLCRPVANGSSRPGLWEGLEFDSASDPYQAFLRRPPDLTGRGIRILISDLFWLGEPVDMLRLLGEQAAGVFVIQLLAKADAEPGLQGNMRIVDCESDEAEDVFVNTAVIQEYKQRLYHHQYNWSQACRQMNAAMSTLVAEEILPHWQLDELVKSQILEVA